MVEPKESKPKAPPAPSNKRSAMPKTARPVSLFAVVRIRGVTGINPRRAHNLGLLGIPKSHYATLVPSSPVYMGMVKQSKDYLSWGPVSEEVLVSMLAKRGETLDGQRVKEAKKPEEIAVMARELMAGKTLKSLGLSRTFRLTPPSGGFKDRKKNYPFGDLGPRPSMDAVIKAMI